VVVLVLAIHQNCDNFFPFSFSPTKWPNFCFVQEGRGIRSVRGRIKIEKYKKKQVK
jgi:hypothetical protein